MAGGLSCRAKTWRQNKMETLIDSFLWPESEVHSDWSINKYERNSSVFDWQKITINSERNVQKLALIPQSKDRMLRELYLRHL